MIEANVITLTIAAAVAFMGGALLGLFCGIAATGGFKK